jgi:hypothetical protein
MDSSIQVYIRGAARRGRQTERIGPFLATFTEDTDNPYLSYAIPYDDRPESISRSQYRKPT